MLSERHLDAPPRGRPAYPMVEAMDHTRGAGRPLFGPRAHKEWQHFVVLGDGVEVLVNFSCCDVRPQGSGAPVPQPRLVFLVREGRWDGDIENFAPESAVVEHGRIRFELGANRLQWRDGAFFIEAELAERPVGVRLELRPKTRPVFVPSTPMRDGPPLHWLVIPRLGASGIVEIGGVRHRLQDAPAYHDHNWGHFLWGHDLSWEWGFILPEDSAVPWCAVFVRLTDRARTTAFDHKLLLWRDGALSRSFREGQITTAISPQPFRPAGLFRVPRALGLVVEAEVPDLPALFTLHAEAGRDRLTIESIPYDVAQVLIPSETDLGVTIFNEVSASVRVHGRVGDESVDFRGRSMMELIRHV